MVPVPGAAQCRECPGEPLGGGRERLGGCGVEEWARWLKEATPTVLVPCKEKLGLAWKPRAVTVTVPPSVPLMEMQVT